MKKHILLLALTLSLSTAAFADGNQGHGNKTCAGGQTSCLTGDAGHGGKKNGETSSGNLTDSGDIFSIIGKYLSGIFG